MPTRLLLRRAFLLLAASRNSQSSFICKLRILKITNSNCTSLKTSAYYHQCKYRHNIGFRKEETLFGVFIKRLLGSSASTPISTNVMTSANDIFQVKLDRFECIILDLRKQQHACESEQFEDKLTGSLDVWKRLGARAVTIYVPKTMCDRIAILAKNGFDFHHAQPGYALMLKWLSDTETNNFPPYANHYVAAAGFVVNDKNQVLAIKERFSGPVAKWKLPGGGAEPGEELGETAQREVMEETGIDSEFVGVICYRQQHSFRYGCSDFYFVCLMKANTTDIHFDKEELLDAQWMDIDEYSDQDLYPSNRYILDSYKNCINTGCFVKANDVPKFTGHGTHLIYRAEQVPSDGRQPDSQTAKL